MTIDSFPAPAISFRPQRNTGFALFSLCILLACSCLLIIGLMGLWHGVSVLEHIPNHLPPESSDLAAEASGFTLVELSIVLVIIGLIVGGILVGRDLIASAQLRAQITQIDKFKSALNTFRLKYDAFPGDMGSDTAAQLGFTARNYATDGVFAVFNPHEQPNDGIIGYSENCFSAGPVGEQTLFWADLGTAGLVAGQFTYASAVSNYSDGAVGGTLSTDLVAPKAMLGNNHVYIVSCLTNNDSLTSTNYFSIAPYNYFNAIYPGMLSITSLQAWQIDTKIDDGQPMTGTVQAQGVLANYGVTWAYDLDTGNPSQTGSGFDQNIPNNPTYCYNNNNNSANSLTNPAGMVYTRANIGACVLSIKAQ